MILVRQNECLAVKQADEELTPHAVRCTQPWRKHELHSALLFHTLQTEISLCPAPTHAHAHTRTH